MSVDASAVARVVGIDTKFEDLRAGSVLFLPQRVAVFAQGESAVSYSQDKVQITSAKQVGDGYGYNSEAYMVFRELFPSNGDGIGTIPATFYPLVDNSGSAAAAGDVAPSGSATTAAAFRIRIGGVLSGEFVIPVGVVDVTAGCISISDAVLATLGMPVKTLFTYGVVTATPDGGNTGDGTVTALSASGAPTPGVYSLICNTAVAEGGEFTLIDPNGVTISTSLVMDIGSGNSTVFVVGGLTFTITDGTADFIIGDSFDIEAPATNVAFTAGWKAATTNDIEIEVIGPSVGVSFAITVMAGGLVNPSITTALAQVGGIWETMFLNCGRFDDTVILDEFNTFGEGRWGQLLRKPMMAFVGCTKLTPATATVVSSTRTADRVNVQLNAPGSPNMPCVVAARLLARIAKVANNNPPKDYGSQRATGITPGTDGEQWDYPQRDQVVKAGASTIEVKDGIVNVADTVTMYAPIGEVPPAYRYAVDIVKLMQVIFNIDLIFANEEWDGAPLIPDNQATTNPAARKPKDAKAQVASVVDALGLAAIISDPETAKESITANIDPGNPKRLNVTVTVQLSGNVGIISVDLKFGFFFGTADIIG